jgi:cytoskeletal protein CcmA (bactofilin family)
MFSKGTKENGASGHTPAGKKEVCIIAFGTNIDGNISIGGDMRLDGTITGDVKCSGRVVMSSNASIKGNIVCNSLVSEGKVVGNISASDKVHFMATAQVKGNISYKGIKVDNGAILNGQLTANNGRSMDSDS